MAHILRVSIVGAMPSGEEWSVNPVWAIGGDFGTPVSPSQANAIATAIAASAVPTTLVGTWSTQTTLVSYRVEARAYDGTLESQAEAVRTAPVPGTGSQPHPFQTSAVVSLRTALAGASGRGRLYWPATGAALDATTLRMTLTTQNNILNGTKTILSTMQAAIDVTLDGVSLCVWSRKNASTQNVTQLQVGNVVDTQRRRRDALLEAYNAVAYP